MGDEPPEPRSTVVVVDERVDPATGPGVDADRWGRLAADVLAEEGLRDPRVELTVHFVDERPIADLKAEHLDGDGGPTDVLAFPVDDPGGVPAGEPVLLGDVLICPSVADRQAAGQQTSRNSMISKKFAYNKSQSNFGLASCPSSRHSMLFDRVAGGRAH